MSTVLNFFKKNPLCNDDLHKILAKIPGYEAQLLPIRSQMLSCCGAEKSKSGKVELVVVDIKRWDALAAEQATINGKLEAINHMVAELDTIFAEIAAAGIEINRKTPAGMWNAAPRTDPPMQMGEYINGCGTRVDKNGLQIKSVIDPCFLSWAERAETAMLGL